MIQVTDNNCLLNPDLARAPWSPGVDQVGLQQQQQQQQRSASPLPQVLRIGPLGFETRGTRSSGKSSINSRSSNSMTATPVERAKGSEIEPVRGAQSK